MHLIPPRTMAPILELHPVSLLEVVEPHVIRFRSLKLASEELEKTTRLASLKWLRGGERRRKGKTDMQRQDSDEEGEGHAQKASSAG